MDSLGAILVLLGIAAVGIGIIWLLVASAKRRPRRNPVLTILAGPILFVVGGVLITAFGPEDDARASSPTYADIASQAAKPSPIPTPIPSGKTRSEPVPYGYSIFHSGIEITVMDVTRGVDLSNAFSSLDEGHEWVVVKLRLVNPGSPDKTQTYNTIDFRVVGKRGVIYDDWLFAPVTDTPLGSGEFFGGGDVVGDIVQQVHKDDGELVLIYSPSFQGSRYLSLYKPTDE